MVISETLYDAVSRISCPDTGDSSLHATYELPREFDGGIVYDEMVLDTWDSPETSPIAARAMLVMEKRIIRVDFKYWDGRIQTFA